MDTKEMLKRNMRAKKTFALEIGIPVKYVEHLISEMIICAKENNDVIDGIVAELWAETHPDSYVHSILDWTKTKAERIAILAHLISKLTFVMDDDNKVYILEKQNV